MKKQFLAALACPIRGWLLRHAPDQGPLGPAERLRIREGLEIHRRARGLYPQGVMVTGDNETCVRRTQEVMSDTAADVIFEGTFIHKKLIAKADILVRRLSGWKVTEVKSCLNNKPEHLDDMAYTTMVAMQSGVDVVACSLLLLSPDYRLGMPIEDLFREADCTEEAKARAKEFWGRYNEICEALERLTCCDFVMRWECKSCPEFETRAGYGYDDPIFNLPRLSHNKFCQLVDQNVHTIKHIPAGFPLTENQEKVRWAVRNNRPWINTDRLREALDRLLFPLCFLDFETVATAIPLYPHVAPFERIPFQYSLHVCAGDGQLMAHHEYLAEPSRDCRRELTEKLLTDCGEEGSIVSYGSFEGSVISDLSRLFPDIARALGGLVVRLVDLCGIIRNNYYHPDFHGSYSLKDVLPVLVPEMGYDDLTVSNGGDATAVFAQMTTGRMEEQEMRQARQDLLRYCGRDTEGMVRLWEALRGVLEHRDNNG